MLKNAVSASNRTVDVDPVPETSQGSAGWMNLAGRVRIRKSDRLANLMLAGALVLLIINVWTLHKEVKKSALSTDSPLQYLGEWIPDRKVYRPGDVVRFTVRFTTKEPELLLLNVDGFRNIDTEEVYPAVAVGRVVHKMGYHEVRSARRLPDYVTPGTYVFEGWAASQTSKRSMPAAYSSARFKVVADGRHNSATNRTTVSSETGAYILPSTGSEEDR